MAEAVGAFLVSLTAIEASGAIALGSTAYTVIGAVAISAASYGIQTALAPGAPSPTAQKQNIKQAIGPRTRYYGEVKIGGTYAFIADKLSHLYQVIMLNAGEIDSFVTHYLGEDAVTLDGSGNVTLPVIYTDKNYATIIGALGTDGQTAFSILTAAFPGEWTTDHRLRGIACTMIRLLSPPAQDFSAIFPNGIPVYNAVIRASKVWDPRDGGQSADDPTTWTWTQNGVLILLDYLWHSDGMRLPRAMIEAAIDVWMAQADIADEPVALKAGGTEPRYRLSGGYPLTSPPKSVLPFMLTPMDARLYLRGDGAIVPDVGRFAAPEITFTDAHIVDYSGMMLGRDSADLKNKITSNFVSPAYLYVEQEADLWLNQASIGIDGEQPVALDQIWSPSHAQTRRRMKVEAYRQNPDWSGQIVTNAYGLRAIDQRFIRVIIAELGLDEIFELLRWQFDVLSGNCTFDISAMPAEAYAWNAATEEGTAPIAAGQVASVDVEDVVDLIVTDSGSRLQAIVDAPTQESLIVQFDWRIHDGGVTDADAVWTPMTVNVGYWSSYSEVLTPEDYDVRARFVPPAGAPGAYGFVRNYALL